MADSIAETCPVCGSSTASEAAFCSRCGTNLQADPGTAAGARALRSITDRITDNLGLDRLEGFSLRLLFSEVFQRRTPDEMERYLGVGTMATTPPLRPEMGHWPRPWLFLRTLVFSLAIYLLLYYTWQRYYNINVIPALIMTGSFAMPLATVILFFELNTPRNVSLVRVVQLVLLGGAVSILVSLWLFDATKLGSWLGPPAAGIVEEIGKLAALLLLARFARQDRYNFSLNGLLFGACIGAGFAAFESAGYALRNGLESSSAMLHNITVRGLLAPFGHVAWTAIAACALWRARAAGRKLTESLTDKRFLVLFAVPVGLHVVWNLPFSGPLMIKYLILGFVAYIVIFGLVQTGLNEVRKDAEERGRAPLDHPPTAGVE
ncbi:MAG: PrsW family glutamic-type intramembrane protease [Candidatus Eisenbacteria bacterium]